MSHPEFEGNRIVIRGNQAPTREGTVNIDAGGSVVISVTYRKTYGAASVTLEVSGSNAVTLYDNNDGSVFLTLTAGINIIANDYSYYGTDGWLPTLRVSNFGSGNMYSELFSPFTPQMSPTYFDGDGYRTGDHGTHVSGIAAAGLNGVGVIGVAPEATVLPIKFLSTPNTGRRYHLALAEALQYAAANNAFVVNNSWGYRGFPVKISLDSNVTVTADRNGVTVAVSNDFIWVDMPLVYVHDVNGNFYKVTDIYASLDTPVYEYAVTNTMLLVFAQGNDGWNSETGRIGFCLATDDCNQSSPGSWLWHGYITLSASSAPDLNAITVFGALRNTYMTITMAGGGSTVLYDVQENQSGRNNLYPLLSTLLADNWLNVVAVDALTVIAPFSNGCGATKDFCLAAPGVSISSSIYEYQYDSAGNITNTITYAGWNGTSMAAPHVSGAAALLKGFFPNLFPRDVAAILKESADGLGSCKGIDKSIYCIDDVYGHGMLNVSASFNPSGTMNISGGATSTATGAGVADKYALAQMRVNLSPVFGAAGWRHSVFNVGALDKYDRVYPTYMSFAGGAAVIQPLFDSAGEFDGAGIHSIYGAPLTQEAVGELPRAEEFLTALYYDSGVGGNEDFRVNSALLLHGNYLHREMGLSGPGGGLSWRYRTGDSSHQPLEAAASDFWQPAFSTSEHHRLAYSRGLPLLPAGGKVGLLYDTGERLQQAGVRLSFGDDNRWQLHGEGGLVSESGQVLGATFSGGLDIEQAATRYRRLSGLWRLPVAARPMPAQVEEPSLFASYVQTDTTVEEASGLLTALHAKADALSFGALWGGWRLQIKRPLVITSGEMRLSVIDGYDDNGAYRVNDIAFDLAAGSRRMQITELHYSGASRRIRGLDYAVGVYHIQNAPARNYSDDSFGVSAALRWRF